MPNSLLKIGVYQIRARVPSDVAAKAKDTLVQVPTGDSPGFIKATTHAACSLKTRDPAEGRNRHADAVAALERHRDFLRRDVVELSFKQQAASEARALAQRSLDFAPPHCGRSTAKTAPVL
ncbi:DUF6538 domain-containing protein [Leisingera sp.]|uniref:DUF6538 domain-containing protein n=1 Tax=Leisingera sp. TaxID=1879318 RepID=UPI002B265D8B|nr:DUF6538 domain-containing protein [Leisingera sp.]